MGGLPRAAFAVHADLSSATSLSFDAALRGGASRTTLAIYAVSFASARRWREAVLSRPRRTSTPTAERAFVMVGSKAGSGAQLAFRVTLEGPTPSHPVLQPTRAAVLHDKSMCSN